MGFAASQARMLRLVSQRSDLELAGQFTAQSRLALANAMARASEDARLVFVNYRRTDTAQVASAVAEALTDHLGPKAAFFDQRTIDIGEVFTASIDAALRQARVLLALVGPTWATVTNPDGGRRLDDPRDLVRTEIERAVQLGLAVVPVLVGRTEPPRWRHLPDSLAVLAEQPSVPLSATPTPAELAELISRVVALAAPE